MPEGMRVFLFLTAIETQRRKERRENQNLNGETPTTKQVAAGLT
jgi:hypothetical protein